MEESVREHCAIEDKKSSDEALFLYRQRLDDEIARALITPYCIPGYGMRSKECGWVKCSQVALDEDFDFYHHTQDEVTEYAVVNRGNAELLISSMSGLHLDEFPGIAESEPIYMVSVNGNHRRLVYACIGLPVIGATIQRTVSNKWRYYLQGKNRSAIKVLFWFKQLGLIDSCKLVDDKTIVLEGKNNIAGWILPDARLGSVGAMLRDTQRRAEALNERFGLEPELLMLLCSRTRRRVSLEWAWMRRKSLQLAKIKK